MYDFRPAERTLTVDILPRAALDSILTTKLLYNSKGKKSMSRTPELSAVQREIVVKLTRGLVLEYEGSSVKLAAALHDAGYGPPPTQQTISGIMHRYVNPGKTVAANLTEFIGYEFSYYFEHPSVLGDLPTWYDLERKAKESTRGAAFAPSSYVAVRYSLLRGPPPKITTKHMLDLVAAFEAKATERTHDLISEWITRDSSAAFSRLSGSRIRTT